MTDRTLYVTDLDGTLLDPSSRVPDESREILNSLIDRGAMITVATARTPATVELLLDGLHAATTPEGRDIPAIVMTGAAYWNRRLRRYDYITLMSDHDSRIIRDAFRAAGINPFNYTLGANEVLEVFHAAPLSDRENAFYRERRNLPLKRFHIGQEAGEDAATVLYFAIGTPDKADILCRMVNDRTRCSAAWYRDIFNPEVAFMDIYAGSCSKANAVKDVARELGCDRIVVFGDNLNDLPMMRVADVAVAVENALPEVRDMASTIIGSNASDSVARFILDDFNARNR